MQQGELFVEGNNEARIHLFRYQYPSKVHVDFHGHVTSVTCNPQHFDSLEWEVHNTYEHNGGLVLVIKWNVSSLREIKWAVYY